MSIGHINERIDDAWRAVRQNAVSHNADRPKLIAVSKVQPDERVRAVLAQGHRCFG